MSSVDSRRRRYQRILTQLEGLIRKTSDPVAHRATAAALLHHKLTGVSWTGFYMLRGGQLIVDAYQGPVACLVLGARTGVCWAAVDRRESVLVPDVHAFPGHVACDPRSRSELVVPVLGGDGDPIGVLDLDSHRPDHFDRVDMEGCEAVVRLLERTWGRGATGDDPPSRRTAE
jgi:GAF domain-containing protein